MTSLGLKKKDIFFLVLYFPFFGVLIFYSLDLEKENFSAGYKEIPLQDSSLAVNNFKYNIEDTFRKNTNGKEILYKYQPIFSILQTYDATENRKAKIYTFKLKKVNLEPKLIEVRINRVKVSVSKFYELQKSGRLISLKFKDLNHLNRDLKFQFACGENGNYEDFANLNTLTINVPDGKTELIIRAVDFKSKICSKSFKITIVTAISLSKHFWFLPILALLIVAPFIYYYFRIKLYQHEFDYKEQLALEQQRNKITADLHDDIGSTLSSLQLNSAVANELMKKNDFHKTEVLLKKIENQSRDLADKIGDIIWSMKSEKDEFMSLSTRIKNFANDILSAVNCNYTIEIDEEIDTLITDITMRKNLILISKEGINNCAKYSKAQNVKLILKKKKRFIKLKISDDGIGFETSINKGNGLRNMRKRAAEINADITINSEINKETKIVLKIPYP